MSKEALEVNTDVQVTVTLADGRAFNLTGTVGCSRTIRPPWHLIEVRLRSVDDGRLFGRLSSKGRTVAKTDCERPVGKRNNTDPERKPDSALSAREQSLRLLANIARHGITSKETISKIIRLTLSPDHVVRRATIPALFQARGPEASVALVNLLHDPNAQTQGDAAEILGRLEASSASEPLKTLLAHDDAMVALRAAEALGRLKDDSGLAVAIRYLRTDQDHTPLAAQVFGVIVGQRFRPTSDGVAQARRYLKKAKW
jgi:HEAT repeat protein